ncbi:bifunctional diaminohydroxyphosphoribosylaminopyrimidine deaminase/5-amino-6-(5-phosphoribosylamino)uracil reductase RibD [Bradyrhizobium sp. WD16]|uniref:bifunctional diaminohydroxyphosphoribosylaminopyrimidine deaminase/5-amino-6-(5-phosphoribosylamino)uracil reductase RibD n=1 Tax=Bradyrhizobium sp. WD16 TaxID=1521768 RepID=UPI0020A2B732|nr:bifunctional diaminohydroxyphosphoribosylaminopyrimidine deaminase/5-amino-6-(5-phosphoribosylamino)uracil reductase RibD [Bradyrhizobium sp. WD16]UTD28848.1 bifunctional diaminohydroxyphosphoribosylaminopyrimidine deaminase/5-amino-6-(5-phosphoribosylamino)uracil reductase RibD [Bradyrhizobium sp. WD16]
MIFRILETKIAQQLKDDSAADRRFMALALALGRRGLGRTATNPAVGAVVVKDGIVLGRGWTAPGGRPHAEPQALARAGAAARGATLYVTLEPCSHHGKTPPCADAVVAAGIARVVSAMEDPNPEVAGQGHARLRAAGIKVDVGLFRAEAERDHAGHIRRVRDGRPHVVIKLAVSRDDKIAGEGRRPVAITGPAAQARTHLLRAQCDAILIGIGTALADDPLLTCRLPGLEVRSPRRVVLDSHLRLPLGGRLARSARQAPLWVITSAAAEAPAAALLGAEGAEVIRLDGTAQAADLETVLRELSRRGVTRLLVEGGSRVAASFLREGLADEFWLLRGPGEIGPKGLDALDGLALAAITDAPQWRLRTSEPLAGDTLTIYDHQS